MDKKIANELLKQWEEMGDSHISIKPETPLRDDAFAMDDALKIELIAKHFKEIMHVLGLDLTDESLQGTPLRVAKMYVNEHFKGLDPKNKPEPTLFENSYKYAEMLVEKNIQFHSTCEHHFVPIYGFAHVAYFSSGKVIGLSKLNRIVDYFARRPQVQERMTHSIANLLQNELEPKGVVVVIEAAHSCMSMRGIKKTGSLTITSAVRGLFKSNQSSRAEVMSLIYGHRSAP
jgi:GTP cyclohydrolase I